MPTTSTTNNFLVTSWRFKRTSFLVQTLYLCNGEECNRLPQYVVNSESISAFQDWSFAFRDTRTANQSGYFVGDRIAMGIQRLTPNPEDGENGNLTVVTATQGGRIVNPTYTPSGGVFNGEYFTSIERPSDGSLDGAWTFKITNPTSINSGLEFTTNNIVGAGANDFVNTMSLSGNRLTPQFNWNFPEGSAHDSIRLTIHDTTRDADGNLVNPQNPDDPVEDQFAKIIHLVNGLPANQTAFVTPEVLTDGTTIVAGRTYDVGIQLNEFSGDRLVSRSRSFFGFTPIDAGTAEVFLPSVNADTGEYEFNVAVEQEVPIVIDPLFAIGYDYEIGIGDPLFSSVRILSDIGDGLYDLFLYDSSLSDYFFTQSLAVGELFNFGLGGVEKFRITGIELAAMLDPSDVTAFMTEVAFVDTGRFTGTMTPIVVDVPVPEPSIIALFTAGLFGIGFARRRKA